MYQLKSQNYNPNSMNKFEYLGLNNISYKFVCSLFI